MSRARNQMPEERETPDYLSSELRQGAGKEWLAEAAEDERLTELLRRRRQDLSAVALDLVHRGDRVRAELGDSYYTGKAVFAGTDFVTIENDESFIDIRSDAAIWIVERSSSGGHEQTGGSTSLKARLSEAATTGEQVRLVTATGRAHIGSIEIVAQDHVELTDGTSVMVVPLKMIAAVVRSKSRQ